MMNDETPSSHTDLLVYLKRLRLLLLVCTVSLMLLIVVWELKLAPIKPGGSWLFLKALPLALPLVGFAKFRLYTHRWVSLFIWLYILEGIVRASSDNPPSNYLAMGQIVLCLIMTMACFAHIRARLGSRKNPRFQTPS